MSGQAREFGAIRNSENLDVTLPVRLLTSFLPACIGHELPLSPRKPARRGEHGCTAHAADTTGLIVKAPSIQGARCAFVGTAASVVPKTSTNLSHLTLYQRGHSYFNKNLIDIGPTVGPCGQPCISPLFETCYGIARRDTASVSALQEPSSRTLDHLWSTLRTPPGLDGTSFAPFSRRIPAEIHQNTLNCPVLLKIFLPAFRYYPQRIKLPKLSGKGRLRSCIDFR